MPTSDPDRSAAARSHVLETATRVLVERPAASLADIAAESRVSRTTLHRMYPTRTDLLRAVALDALDALENAFNEVVHNTEAAAVPGASREGMRTRPPLKLLRHLVEVMLPLGPRLRYLVTAPELGQDDLYVERAANLDKPIHEAVAAAQRLGELDPMLRPLWVAEVLYAVVFVAWEQIDAGTLAPADAVDLVMRTWLAGAQPLRE